MSRWKKPDDEVKPGTINMREWSETEAGKAYKAKHAEYAREWRKSNREKFKATQRRANQGIRLECLQVYSGLETPECRCCGETMLEFLHLDHVNGGGKADREAKEQKHGKGISATGFFYALKKAGFPQDPPLQVLCANCNLGKRCGKYCPHELERGVALDGTVIPESERGRFAKEPVTT